MDRANPDSAAALQQAWPRATQLATAFLLGAAAALLGVQVWQAQASGSRPSDLQRVQAPIDLNQASRAELMQLPGVGPALAERIETHRQRHGSFRSTDELLQVPGIGPATLARIEPWVMVSEPERIAATAPPETPVVSKLDINQATRDELQQLPGIGPVLSQRIVEQRQKARFERVDDLRRVPGIGPKTLEKLRPLVCVRNEV
jgi:competence protein ComEA